MLYWYSNLDLRGKFALYGVFGLVVNGIIFFLGIWMPILLGMSILALIVAACMKSEDSTDI